MSGSGSRRRSPHLESEETSAVFRDTVLALDHRKRMVEAMTRHAREQGLDATEALVSKHYDWFHRYYTGVLATGYLMRRTGVKRIDRLKTFKGE